MRKNISILLIICFVFSLFPSPMIAGGGKKEKVEIIEWSSQSYLYVEENSAGVTKVGKGATVLQQDANSAKVMYSLTTQKSIQGKKIKEVKSIKATDLWHRDKVDSWWLDFWDAYNSRRGITGGNEITGYEVKDGVLNVSANVYVSPPYYNGQIHTRDLLDITEKYAFDYFRALGASIPDSMERKELD